MLSFMLIKYDWLFKPGYILPDSLNFESRVAAPNVRVQYRRRKEETDILKMKKAT